MVKTYMVNEMFYSLQGEGARAGTANVFVRLSACNLKCSRDVDGFDCDTEFTSGVAMTGEEIVERARSMLPVTDRPEPAVIVTGGEPLLQLDTDLVARFKAAGFFLAVETNGTLPAPVGIDWVSCSPKTAEHTLKLEHAAELRYVRGALQGIPKPRVKTRHHYLSPAFNADGSIDRDALRTCVALCLANPLWRLSVQQHKLWAVR